MSQKWIRTFGCTRLSAALTRARQPNTSHSVVTPFCASRNRLVSPLLKQGVLRRSLISKVGAGYIVHLAVDTLGHLLAAYLTPANEQEACGDVPFVRKLRNWPNGCNGSRAVRLKSPSLMKATLASNPSRTPPRRASTLFWSSAQPTNAASSCCPNAGSWSAALPGSPAFADSPVTMNASLKS